MSGRKSRNKGKRGERAFRLILADLDWSVVNTGDGDTVEDAWAVDPNGCTWSVEIKNCKLIDLCRYRKQAREQAARSKLPWLLAVKLPNTSSWLVERQGEKPIVWHSKGEE